jgi:hypothetical protein
VGSGESYLLTIMQSVTTMEVKDWNKRRILTSTGDRLQAACLFYLGQREPAVPQPG